MLSRFYYTGLRATGLPALARHALGGGVILCYHNVVARGESAGDPGLHLPADDFARQIRWLGRRYAVIPLEEVAERIRRRLTLRGTAAITFDDAYAGLFEHAWPVLRASGLPATVFVPTLQPHDDHEGFWWDHPLIVGEASPVRRRLQLTELGGDASRIDDAFLHGAPSRLPATHRRAGWAAIANAAMEGLALGVHSATHRNLVRLRDGELRRELVESRETLLERTGVRATSFAYPYGLADARVRDAVRDAGYDIAVTLRYGLNTTAADPLMLRRVNVPASIGTPAYQAWTSGLRARWGA